MLAVKGTIDDAYMPHSDVYAQGSSGTWHQVWCVPLSERITAQNFACAQRRVRHFQQKGCLTASSRLPPQNGQQCSKVHHFLLVTPKTAREYLASMAGNALASSYGYGPGNKWCSAAFCRSILWRRGLPVGNPYSRLYWCWCAYVLLLDSTYTAFIVPIGVGFDTSYAQWNWTGYLDFIAGSCHGASVDYLSLQCKQELPSGLCK